MKKIYFVQSLLAKGESLCRALNDVLTQLEEIDFDDPRLDNSQQEVINDLFELIVKVAILFCGDTNWAKLKAFLQKSEIELPDDFEKFMALYESLSDNVPDGKTLDPDTDSDMND